jgi:hypothetical protein
VTTFAILAGAAFYLTLGCTIGWKMLPMVWRYYARINQYDARLRAVTFLAVTAFWWPLLIPVMFLGAKFLLALDRVDPVLAEKRAEEQQEKIRDLERELKIGRRGKG